MFSWLTRKKKEEEKDPMATLDEKQIDKAEEDIEEKGADSQTEQDRVDESVADQEKADGNEDSQDAKDRVDENEGEEKESDFARLEKKFDMLFELIEKIIEPKEEDKDAQALENAKARYGVGNTVFADKEEAKQEITAKEAAEILRNLKN